MTVNDPVATAIATAAVAAGTRGLPLERVWAVAQDAEPELAWAPGRRQRLAAVLAALADAGQVTYSTARHALDTTGSPPLPRRITATGIAPRPPRAPRPTVPTVWRPELEGVHRLDRPRPDELEALHVVNAWLRDRMDDCPVVPLRERSWELFGDEKRLDRLVTSRLFRDGVLSVELLRTFVVHPPFVHQRLADHGDALICENHQTYHSALTVLASGDRRGFAVVGYGAGNQFPSAVSYVEDLHIDGTVVYFGDLDPDGLRIAAAAARQAELLDLPPVVPATGLYDLLLASATTARASAVTADQAADLARWLHPTQRDRAASLLAAGHRVPQEAVTAAAMTAAIDWR